MIISTIQIIAETLKAEGKSCAYIYRYILKEFEGTPYKWAGSNLNGSDCSGSVCAALSYATDYFIRLCADELYRRVFNIPILYCGEDKEEISAAFFLDETGKAVHVAGFCGNGLFMNVSSKEDDKRGKLRTLDELKNMYPHLQIYLRKLRKDYGNEHL